MHTSSQVTHQADGYRLSKQLHLRPFEEQDSEVLYRIANNAQIRHLWAPALEEVSIKKFKEWLHRRIMHRWDEFVVIERQSDRAILGFANCYNINDMSSTASMCLVFDPEFMNHGLCAKAAYLYLAHLFYDCDYRKIYAEVHEYNAQCVTQLERAGFDKEAELKEHQLWHDKFWNLLIFSLNKDSFQKLHSEKSRLMDKLSCRITRN